MSARSRVIVTIADEHLGSINSVARALRGAGLHIDNILNEVGVIQGDAAHDCLSRLRGIAGVADVSVERDVQIPPPDAEVQ